MMDGHDQQKMVIDTYLDDYDDQEEEDRQSSSRRSGEACLDRLHAIRRRSRRMRQG